MYTYILIHPYILIGLQEITLLGNVYIASFKRQCKYKTCGAYEKFAALLEGRVSNV